jgi:hypothetical protein
METAVWIFVLLVALYVVVRLVMRRVFPRDT